MILGKLDSYIQKKDIRSLSLNYLLTTVHRKWMEVLNGKPETTKWLEENRKCFRTHWKGHRYLITGNKSNSKQNYDYVEFRSSVLQRKQSAEREREREITYREKIFPLYISDKELISRIHKELKQLYIKNKNKQQIHK